MIKQRTSLVGFYIERKLDQFFEQYSQPAADVRQVIEMLEREDPL